MNAILHQQLGARFFERDGVLLPRDYGDTRAEYRALRAGAGIIALSNFGALRVEGRDRVPWLHKLVTANVEGLGAGIGTYALLLNPTGHVVADFVLLPFGDALLLYTSVDAKEKLFASLRRAIFREKVSLNDVSDDFTLLSLQGPHTNAVIEKISGTLPAREPFTFVDCEFGGAATRYAVANHHVEGFASPLESSIARDDLRMPVRFTAARHSRAGRTPRDPEQGSDGLDLLVSRANAAALWEAVIEHGARPVGFDALNVARVEAGIPWYGDDFDETTLAPEARLEEFIAENKGCYTGQEVIARIKNRGHVNRLLTRLQVAAPAAASGVAGQVVPERGDKVLSDSREVGWITSAVWSFECSAPLAFGYLSRELARDGTRVHLARGEVRLSAIVQAISR